MYSFVLLNELKYITNQLKHYEYIIEYTNFQGYPLVQRTHSLKLLLPFSKVLHHHLRTVRNSIINLK